MRRVWIAPLMLGLASFGMTGCKQVSQLKTTALQMVSALQEAKRAEDPNIGTIRLSVYASKSLEHVLTQIGDYYKQDYPEVKLVYNFDSSERLKEEILSGADCDVFVSASGEQMDDLDTSSESQTDQIVIDLCQEDTVYILPESRKELLENKIALCVPKDNPAHIQSFEDMAEKLKAGEANIFLENEEYPDGWYVQDILHYYGLYEEELAEEGLLSYGRGAWDVIESLQKGQASCGLVYMTDAKASNLTIVDTSDSKICGRVIYEGAVMNTSGHEVLGRDFLSYLLEDTAHEILEDNGFIAFEQRN